MRLRFQVYRAVEGGFRHQECRMRDSSVSNALGLKRASIARQGFVEASHGWLRACSV